MTHKLRTILIVISTSVVGLALFVVLGWWLLAPPMLSVSLPSLVNGRQDAVILEDATVSSLTLTGAVLHDVKVLVPGTGAVTVDRAEVRYSVAGLLDGVVDRVHVYGLTLDVNPEAVKKAEDTVDNGATDSELILPPLGPITISDGLVRFTRNGRSFEIPFGLDASISKDGARAEVRLWATPPGGAVDGELKFDTLIRSVDFSLRADNVSLLHAVSLFFPEHSGLTATGLLSASLSGSMDLETMLPTLREARAEVLSPVLLRGGRCLASGDRLALVVTQTSGNAFTFDLSPAFAATDMVSGTLHGSGSLTRGSVLNDYRTEFHGSYGFSGNATLPGASALLSTEGEADGFADDWGWSVKASGPVTLEPALGSATLRMQGGLLVAEAEFEQGKLSGSCEFSAKGAAFVQGSLKANATGISVSGSVTQGEGEILSGPLSVSLAKVGVTSPDYSGGCGPVSFNGKLSVDQSPALDGTIKIRSGWGVFGQHKVGGASATLPVAYPFKRGLWGGLEVARIESDKRELGALSFRVRQNMDQLDLDGSFNGTILPGFKAKISGRITPLAEPLFSVVAEAKDYHLPQSFKPQTLSPALKGLTISGLLGVRAEIEAGGCGFRGTGFLTFADGFVADPANDVHFSGLALSLSLEDLATLRSAPLQKVTFDRLDFKGISATKGQVTFQLVPDGSVVVEGVRFQWAEGNVQALPFTLVPGKDEYDLILYCSEMNIANLLKQLGFADAEGEGRVSGRVPVMLRDGRLYFDTARLQSSPDSGGVIKVKQAESLLAGVPKESPQYIQMKIASEALKNFEYKWAMITATTEKDTLKIQLQLDGKPADTLPFEYRADIGQLIEITAGSKGVKFQGIRLDVNFNLPLNKILDLKRLFELVQ